MCADFWFYNLSANILLSLNKSAETVDSSFKNIVVQHFIYSIKQFRKRFQVCVFVPQGQA